MEVPKNMKIESGKIPELENLHSETDQRVLPVKSETSKKQRPPRRPKGPGLRVESILENPHPHKWRWIRWSFLLSTNFLFFASFYFDIQILEGTLSGSRLLGFHLADPFASFQVMLASRVFNINLIIGL